MAEARETGPRGLIWKMFGKDQNQSLWPLLAGRETSSPKILPRFGTAEPGLEPIAL